MSHLHKSKRYDLIDMFNDTRSRYLEDIFTIDDPEFEKHIPDYNVSEQKKKGNLDLVWNKHFALKCSQEIHSEETLPLSSPHLIVSRLDSFSPSRFEMGGVQSTLAEVFLYYFYHLRCLCNDFYYLSALVGCWSSVFK